MSNRVIKVNVKVAQENFDNPLGNHIYRFRLFPLGEFFNGTLMNIYHWK